MGQMQLCFLCFSGGGPAEALFGCADWNGDCVFCLVRQSMFLTNEIVCYAFCSALGGNCSLGLIRKYVMAYAVDPALMGNIMLLIPGYPVYEFDPGYAQR